jgi:hypothetical protein
MSLDRHAEHLGRGHGVNVEAVTERLAQRGTSATSASSRSSICEKSAETMVLARR